jgi:hypothetical protein
MSRTNSYKATYRQSTVYVLVLIIVSIVVVMIIIIIQLNEIKVISEK